MIHVLIKHQVANFKNWRELFEAHRETRIHSGCIREWVFQREFDENEVTVLLAWDNEERARSFFQSQELKEIMRKSGVMQKPEIRFLKQVEFIDFKGDTPAQEIWPS